MNKLVRALTPAALALALVTGCSGGPEASAPTADRVGGSASSGSASSAQSPTGDGTPPRAADWIVLGEDTPLGPYRTALNGPPMDFDTYIKAVVDSHDKREAFTATCMKDAGFEFYPAPYAGSTEPEPDPYVARGSYLLVPPLDEDRNNVATWGYGMDPEFDDVVLRRDPEGDKVREKSDAYLATLTPAAQEQYWVALSGPDWQSEDPDVRQNPRPGCGQKSYNAFPEIAQPAANENFLAAYDDLRRAVVQVTTWDVGMDPRVVALDQEWATCAAGKGLDFAGQDFLSEAEIAEEGAYGGGNSFGLRPSPSRAIGTARFEAEDGSEVPAEDALLTGRPRQLAIALADYDCREETDYLSRILEIQNDVEQRFVDKNRDQLEEMRSAAAREG